MSVVYTEQQQHIPETIPVKEPSRDYQTPNIKGLSSIVTNYQTPNLPQLNSKNAAINAKPQIKHHVINSHLQQQYTAPTLPNHDISTKISGLSSSVSVSSSIKSSQQQSSTPLALSSTAKSQLSSGYRYTKGCLVEAPTYIQQSPSSASPPQSIGSSNISHISAVKVC